MNNPAKLTRFSFLDGRIKRNLIEAGQDLEEIRDDELYLSAGFKTFGAYCESIGKNYHWGWRTIEAGKVQATVSAPLPNEAVTREVAKIAKPQREEVVSRALEATGGKLTAQAIKNAATVKPERIKQPLDGTGLEITPEVSKFWARNVEIQEQLKQLKAIRLTVQKADESGDKLYSMIDRQGTISRLKSIEEELESAMSFAICDKCNGVLFADCRNCNGRGTLSKHHWKFVPIEIRKLRPIAVLNKGEK